MKIKTQRKLKNKKGLLVVPIFHDDVKKLPEIYTRKVKKFITARIKDEKFSAKKCDVISTFTEARDLPPKMVLMGFGDAEKFKKTSARRFGARIAKQAHKMHATELTILMPEPMGDYAEELLEGIMMRQYKFNEFKTKKDDKYELEKLNLVTERAGKELKPAIEKADLIASTTEFVKNLVNGPSNFVDSEHLAREARRIAKENRYKIAILGKKELTKMKWGGILAVNQGSDKDPKCIVLEYMGGDKNEKPIVLVGKGVIFDTGGYNLKPTRGIETMHQDMAGAATVLGVFSMLKKLGIKKNVVGITPVAENLVNAKAYKPSDIITMLSGATVEVTNTDAEGRLILADAIHFSTKMDPECIITIATLTGAVSVALGNRYAGLIGNSRKLSRKLRRAGNQVDDKGWALPLPKEYKSKMDSHVADIRNADLGTSRYAGSSKGAAFLERFVDGNKWCHIDIGGTAFTTEPKEYEGKGATAHGLRMLARFLENESD